jgi:hypothetical protein
VFLDVFYQVKIFCHVFGNSCCEGLRWYWTWQKNFTLIVMRASFRNVMWKDKTERTYEVNTNFMYSCLLVCDTLTQQHTPEQLNPHLSKFACWICENDLSLFEFIFFLIYFLCHCVTEVFFSLDQCTIDDVQPFCY